MFQNALKLMTLLALPLLALPASAEEVRASLPSPAQTWGLETDVAYALVPGVRAYTLNATHTLWGERDSLRGDVVFGIYLRPRVAHNVVETLDEYLLNAGYRQYLWKGLHAEVMLQGGYAWGWNNALDGKDYQAPSILAAVHAGYRFAFLEDKAFGFYVLPQVGYLQGLYTNIGPRLTPDRFFSAKLILGASF